MSDGNGILDPVAEEHIRHAIKEVRELRERYQRATSAAEKDEVRQAIRDYFKRDTSRLEAYERERRLREKALAGLGGVAQG